jgi:CubicO group peptidase (beta-lactamase class C family)
MVSSLNPTQYVLDKPMVADPGTTWDYNSGVSHLLGAILRETAGQTPSNFGREFLFNPLGIDLVSWEADHTGLSFGSHGLSMRPRDMAKLGFLYLHDGEWDGQQIVPQAWVSQSRATATTAAWGYGYGYQWWQVPTLDIYMALGGGYQIIIVSQAQDLVMVMTANDLTGIMDPMAIVEEFVFGAITNQYISPLSIGLVIAAAIGIPVAVGAGIILWRRRRTSTPSSSGQTA